MKIRCRTERFEDHSTVDALIEAAFRDVEYSDHREQVLVNRLRDSPAFVPKLSIVAEVKSRIVGHILLTEAVIANEQARQPILALAPLSVLPEFQRRGIGSRLIREAHLRAEILDYTAIVLLGHQDYYPRFGYLPARNYNITFPFDAPDENCMVKILQPGALDGISGQVVYPEAFS